MACDSSASILGLVVSTNLSCVNCDDVPQGDPGTADLDSSVLAAFERGLRLGKSWRRHYLRQCNGEFGKLNLAHFGREVDCADLRLFGDVPDDDIRQMLAGAPDVAGRVFWNKRLARPVGDADADDGRAGAQVVVGAKRVQRLAARSHPCC
jgi:hypothetical protein